MPRVMVCGAFSSLMQKNASGGYGFSSDLRTRYLDVLAVLTQSGFETLSAHREDAFGESEWVEDFVERDLAWTETCDVQLILLPADALGEACRSDGTMVEMGYALAHGKPLVVLADDVQNERNSFFLRSFIARKAAATVSWTGEWSEGLIKALESCLSAPCRPQLREQRTDVDRVIDDLRRDPTPHLVRVSDLDLIVLPGVLSPRLSHAPDALIARWHIPSDSRVLDLGCGCGVLGIAALAQGARSLLALDINPAAIETTALNLRALGFADRAEARHSDAFSALKPGELFDVIIFAAPYWDRPAMDFLEKSCFDTSYKFFGEAVQDAHHWLAQDGSMYVIFSDQGDVNHALGLIENSNVRVHKTHLVRPTKHGGHIRIIWELRHADILGMSNEPTANGGTSSP